MTLKKTLGTLLIVALALGSASAQKKGKKVEQPKGYEFTTVKANPITSIKNQSRTSTCWCFSALSFLESEAIKNGAPADIDIAEMYIVGNAYVDRAEKYVRLGGKLNFSPGSSFGDVIATMQKYGAVPQSEYPGICYGLPTYVHGELDATTKAYVDAMLRKPNGTLSPVWKEGFRKIVETYLGEAPEKFVINGKEYTPETYVTDYLKLNLDDYVSLTSFTHHPFYKQFAIEVPDNWRWDLNYNLPIDELIQVMDNAIENGYTFAWASDISEKGFSGKGIAIVADVEANERSGSDQDRWLGVSAQDKASIVNGLTTPGIEKKITQEMRQEEFDNQRTTDDHGMHIFGIAKDQNGTKYYMVKNSWGETGTYKGIWYASEPFVRFKTMNILVNKNAIPAAIRAKLGI